MPHTDSVHDPHITCDGWEFVFSKDRFIKEGILSAEYKNKNKAVPITTEIFDAMKNESSAYFVMGTDQAAFLGYLKKSLWIARLVMEGHYSDIEPRTVNKTTLIWMYKALMIHLHIDHLPEEDKQRVLSFLDKLTPHSDKMKVQTYDLFRAWVMEEAGVHDTLPGEHNTDEPAKNKKSRHAKKDAPHLTRHAVKFVVSDNRMWDNVSRQRIKTLLLKNETLNEKANKAIFQLLKQGNNRRPEEEKDRPIIIGKAEEEVFFPNHKFASWLKMLQMGLRGKAMKINKGQTRHTNRITVLELCVGLVLYLPGTSFSEADREKVKDLTIKDIQKVNSFSDFVSTFKLTAPPLAARANAGPGSPTYAFVVASPKLARAQRSSTYPSASVASPAPAQQAPPVSVRGIMVEGLEFVSGPSINNNPAPRSPEGSNRNGNSPVRNPPVQAERINHGPVASGNLREATDLALTLADITQSASPWDAFVAKTGIPSDFNAVLKALPPAVREDILRNIAAAHASGEDRSLVEHSADETQEEQPSVATVPVKTEDVADDESKAVPSSSAAATAEDEEEYSEFDTCGITRVDQYSPDLNSDLCPMVGKCGHSFCQKNLLQWFDVLKGTKKYIPCLYKCTASKKDQLGNPVRVEMPSFQPTNLVPNHSLCQALRSIRTIKELLMKASSPQERLRILEEANTSFTKCSYPECNHVFSTKAKTRQDDHHDPRAPIVGHCGHSFCISCINVIHAKFLKDTGSKTRKTFACPSCISDQPLIKQAMNFHREKLVENIGFRDALRYWNALVKRLRGGELKKNPCSFWRLQPAATIKKEPGQVEDSFQPLAVRIEGVIDLCDESDEEEENDAE